MKTSTILLILLITSLVSCEKHKSLWEISPCEFTSDEEAATLRESRSFKIIDATTFENLVDNVNAPIHPDSVRLFDSNLDELLISKNEPNFYRNEWTFGRFFPYTGVPYNDDKALLELEERVFYLSTSYDNIDTIVVLFEKCRIKSALFNSTNTLRPKNDKSQIGASFYFKK
ncbi:MAG: hypothetical protein ACI9P5_004546 [Saprospiraceae bacterium]|jgi:hypothetical protein